MGGNVSLIDGHIDEVPKVCPFCGCHIEVEKFVDGFAICPMCEKEVEYSATEEVCY